MSFWQIQYPYPEQFVFISFYTTEQLIDKGLAQEPSSRSLAVLGLELRTLLAEVQCRNHSATTDHWLIHE